MGSTTRHEKRHVHHGTGRNGKNNTTREETAWHDNHDSVTTGYDGWMDDGWMNGWMRWMNGCDGCDGCDGWMDVMDAMDGWMDGWMDAMDGWMRWMDGWM